jgi:hypothetical protein
VAVLLIPYEARTPCRSIRAAALRGVLCASIFSLGVLTKVSFFYFVALILPVLLFIRFHSGGIRSAWAWLVGFICVIAPTAIYLLRYGRYAFAAGSAASFGGLADFYHVPLRRFLADTFLESPGLLLSLLLVAAALVYLVVKNLVVKNLGAKKLEVKKQPIDSVLDVAPFLIMGGYGAIVLASANREVRFGFAVMVALPFLVSILISNKEDSLPAPRASLIAGLAFLGLAAAALPMRNRSYQHSLASANAVLGQAARCKAKNILLATDSPSLNVFLLDLASALSSSDTSNQTLAYHAMKSVPIQDDFAALGNSDIVVFQDAARLRPKFTNQRKSEYEQYMQRTSSVPIRVADDTNVYAKRCSP